MMVMASPASATFLATFDYSGFFGLYALGLIYRINESNEAEVSVGMYRIDHKHYRQTNFSYRYSHWLVSFHEYEWRPLQVGFFGIFAGDGGKYFSESPSKYPSPGYYDQTSTRLGFEAGSTFTFTPNKLEIAYRIRVLDTGLLAVYNNAHRDLQYYMSTGLSLHYIF